MRWPLIVCMFLLGAPIADAHVPAFVIQESNRDITHITEPELSRIFYGTFDGFPHTFQIDSNEPFLLSAQIMQPDIESSKNNISGIIIKEIEGTGRVEEVARLNAKEASWETEFRFFSGDSYRIGPSFEGEVGPGVYRVEVNTPDNIEKYVLILGHKEEGTSLGYIETIRTIAGIKDFFEKPAVSIFQSPFVSVPAITVLLLAAALRRFFIMKKRRSNVL